MSERWRDKKGDFRFAFQPWMRTVDELEDQIAELVAALRSVRKNIPDGASTAFEIINAALAKAEDQS